MTSHLTGPNNVTRSQRQNTSYKKPWVQVYEDTILDSWFVGDYSSANYHITVEFDSNQKETMQVLVVARPEHASYTVFGRTCIQDELITLSASVTASKMTLTANPASPEFAGAKVIFTSLYSETITPLELPTIVPVSTPSTGGMPTPSEIYGTFGTIEVNNQPSIVASYDLDTLTLSQGTGIGITVDSVTKTITLSSTANMFRSFAVTGSTTLTPSSTNDILTLTGSNGIVISTNDNSNTVDVALSLPAATIDTLGGVRVDGSSIIVNNGVISSTANMYVLPTASQTEKGGVKVDGTTITINNGVISGVSQYVLPTASQTEKGGVKVDGTSITINNNGVISGVSQYVLPTASETEKGGVKIDGTTITINNGVISATEYSLLTASETVKGGVKIDNSTIKINNGVISVSSTISTGLSIGTSLTIPSGDTLSRPTATQGNLRFNTTLGKFEGYYGTSWGAVGGGLSPTAIQTEHGYIAKANDLVRCNTTSSAFSITLPSAPVDGDIIGVVDTHRKFALNNLTILVSGSKKIEDDTTSLVLDIDGTYVALVYNDIDSNWRVLETPVGTGIISTTVVTSNGYVASVNDLVRCDTTLSAFSVTLPTNPNDGSIVNFVDIASAGSFFAHNLTVLPGSGSTIENDTSLLLDINGTYVSLVYNASATNWKVLQSPYCLLGNVTTSVTLSGLTLGTGNDLTNAVAGTHYQAPIGTISGLVKGNGANALTVAESGTDYVIPSGSITGTSVGFSTYSSIQALLETATITGSAPAETTNFNVITQAVQYYTSNTSTNFTFNIRGDATTTLNSIMAVGKSVTIALLVTNSTTAYYPSTVQIDGTTQTVKWQNGTALTSGNVSAIDVYTFTIIKTAADTYTTLGSQTKFA